MVRWWHWQAWWQVAHLGHQQVNGVNVRRQSESWRVKQTKSKSQFGAWSIYLTCGHWEECRPVTIEPTFSGIWNDSFWRPFKFSCGEPGSSNILSSGGRAGLRGPSHTWPSWWSSSLHHPRHRAWLWVHGRLYLAISAFISCKCSTEWSTLSRQDCAILIPPYPETNPSNGGFWNHYLLKEENLDLDTCMDTLKLYSMSQLTCDSGSFNSLIGEIGIDAILSVMRGPGICGIQNDAPRVKKIYVTERRKEKHIYFLSFLLLVSKSCGWEEIL